MNSSAIKRNKFQINHGETKRISKESNQSVYDWLKTLFSFEVHLWWCWSSFPHCIYRRLHEIRYRFPFSTTGPVDFDFDMVCYGSSNHDRTHTHHIPYHTIHPTQFNKKVAHYTVGERWRRAVLEPSGHSKRKPLDVPEFRDRCQKSACFFCSFDCCYCATLAEQHNTNISAFRKILKHSPSYRIS